MYDAQLEMSFTVTGNYITPRRRRLNRAQWWFQRMRQIVDRAVDWQPTPPPRPEQIWFPGSHRPPRVGSEIAPEKPHRRLEEQEVCA